MNQGYGISQFYEKKIKTIGFTGDWLLLTGDIERKGSWLIWGASGNGKTVFAAKLAKYLSGFERVIYNSLEEGLSVSLRRAFKLAGVSAKDKITVLDKEPISELRERLRKPKSPNLVIVDSFQYSGLTAVSYKKLLAEFDKKLFVFISHADGKEPSGRSAKTVKFDANVKIWIEGYKAFAVSRYGGDKPYIIWDKGAEDYWNKLNEK